MSSASAPGFYAQLEPVVGAVVADENRDGVRVLCARCAAARAATVGVANENLGKLLVDSQGRTLYLFRKGLWNEERVHPRLRNRMAATASDRQATVGGGATASIVASSARSDGKPQVMYNGHPLYLSRAIRSPATPTARA